MNAMTPNHPEVPQIEFVETRLGRLAVHARGSGERTIILWPSIFTDHRIFERLARTLSDRFRFLLIDGPGHGGSDGVKTEFTMEDCAVALRDIMDHNGLNSAVVGGTSWGGLVAAELALSTPDRVDALILMNTPMEIDGTRPSLSSRLIALGARWGLRSRTFRNGVAKSFFGPDSLAAQPEYEGAFHAMLSAANPRTLAPAIRSVILRGAPLLPKMKDLVVPTLVIAGEEDNMYPLEVQAEAALTAPRGRIEPVSGRHISAVDAPDEVATAIAAFLEREAGQ